MNKKICAAALAGALALITLGLTGCGDGNTAESTEKAASFTYWLMPTLQPGFRPIMRWRCINSGKRTVESI